MSNDKTLVVRINGDAENLRKEFDRIKGETASLENALGSVAKTSAIAFAGLTAAAVGLVAAYRGDEQAAIRTNATLKATGYAAGLTAEELFKMSAGLEDVTTFSDDTILSAQNLLLTFKNVGKDVFPQATESILNVATAMGSDANSAAIQLGKALNDPIQGISALTRIGVGFTDQQKDQIKVMQESGDIIGAQKIILAELESQMGGVARAATNGTGVFLQLKNAMDGIFENIGKAIFETIQPFTIKLLEMVKAFRDNHPEMQKLIGNLIVAGTVVTGLITILASFGVAMFTLRAGLAVLGISFSATWALATGGLTLLIPLIYSGIQAMGGWDAVLSTVEAGFTVLTNNVKIGLNDVKIIIGEVIAKTYELAAATLEAIPGDAFKEKVANFRAMAEEMKAGSDELIDKNVALRQSYEQILDGISAEKAAAKVAEQEAAMLAEREKAAAAEAERKAAEDEAKRGYEAQQRQLKGTERTNAFEADRQIQQLEKELLQLDIDKASEVEKLKLQQKIDALKKIRAKGITEEQKQDFENKDALRKAAEKDAAEELAFKKKFGEDTLSAASNLGSRLLKEGTAARKGLFLVEKASALATVAVNTAVAVSRALASAPPPLNFALAAATGAAGAIQAASIIATAFGAQDGALVGGMNSRRTGDRVPFMLEDGELVVPKQNFEEVVAATARARGYDTGGSSSGSTKVEIEFIGDAAQLLTARQFENTTLGTDRG